MPSGRQVWTPGRMTYLTVTAIATLATIPLDRGRRQPLPFPGAFTALRERTAIENKVLAKVESVFALAVSSYLVEVALMKYSRRLSRRSRPVAKTGHAKLGRKQGESLTHWPEAMARIACVMGLG